VSVVELKNITKKYSAKGIETLALKGINLNIDEGEFLAITGPSGCGKSTLLSILGLIDEPTSGSYTLANLNTAALSPNERAQVRNRHIGFVFQSFNLIDRLNVFENVALPSRYRRDTSDVIEQTVMQALDSVGMKPYLKKSPAHLSGGQQQRVAIARAIASSPELLVVDEPTGNLDSVSGDQVMALLATLNAAGTTIVMVTHNDSYTRYASRRLSLLDGQITACTTEGLPRAFA